MRDVENSENSIEIENATLRWTEDSICLKDVTMTIEKGKTVVVTGSVGAGKSSLLGALTNQMLLDHGSVRVTSSTSYAPQVRAPHKVPTIKILKSRECLGRHHTTPFLIF